MSEALFAGIERANSLRELLANIARHNYLTATGAILEHCSSNGVYGDYEADTEIMALLYACKAMTRNGVTNERVMYDMACNNPHGGQALLAQCELGTFVAWYEQAKKAWH